MKPHGTFIQGEVASLTDNAVTIKDGRSITFDLAAIATGSSCAVGKADAQGAVTMEARRAELQVHTLACPAS
jgi:hypothetical protein